MFNNEALIELSDPNYWDKRYASQQSISQHETHANLDSFEWFRSFDQIRQFFAEYLPSPDSGCHILQLGCGNSTLTSDLYTLGYTNQTSIDFSKVVIDAMKSKYSDLETCWAVMDVRELELSDGSVDVAIDKGTLDAMIHGSLWDPPADVRENVGRYLDEVTRVLKPGGQWLYITYRQPHFVKILLEREEIWDLSFKTIGNTQGTGEFEYFGFIMKKHQTSSIS